MRTKNKIPVSSQAKGLIFDLDGTLADTMPFHYLAWQTMGKKYNFTLTPETFQKYAGIPTYKYILKLNEVLGCNMNPEVVIVEKEKAFLENFDKIKLIEPVMEIVYQYHNLLPISIGTGGRKPIVEKIVKAVGLDKYFSIIATADDVENHKPAPDTFLKCAELMEVKPQACQVFEDGIQGLNAAKTAGMLAVDVRLYL